MIFTAIIVAIIGFFTGYFQYMPTLPPLSSSINTLIDTVIDSIYMSVQILYMYFGEVFVNTLFILSIAFLLFDFIYYGVFWIFRKIPFINIRQ